MLTRIHQLSWWISSLNASRFLAGSSQPPEKNYDFRKDPIGGFDATDCSTASPLLGAGRTLGRHAVSDHARRRPTTVFSVAAKALREYVKITSQAKLAILGHPRQPTSFGLFAEREMAAQAKELIERVQNEHGT